jgi:hypothetical protein
MLAAIALAIQLERDHACKGICQDRHAITGWFLSEPDDRPVRVCGCVYPQEANIPRKEKKGLTPAPVPTVDAKDYMPLLTPSDEY